MDFVSITIAMMALGLLIIFVLMISVSIFRTWKAAAQPSPAAPIEAQAFIYVATAVAALVGGVLAVAVGQPNISPPSNQNQVIAAQATPPSAVAALQPKISQNKFTAKLPENWQENLKGMYLITYVLMGFAAIATWALKQSITTDTVKNLGVTFFGLAITSVGAAFQTK